MLEFLKSKCETIIVKGNHDNFIGPLTKHEIEVSDYKIIDDYLICHGDKVLDVKEKYKGIIIGLNTLQYLYLTVAFQKNISVF